MAKSKGTAVAVHVTDPVKVAFNDAMARIEAAKPVASVIASISAADWDALDESAVNPNVADSDGLDFCDEDEDEHVAA